MARTRHKVLPTRLFWPAFLLTALLIHVVDILHWNVIFPNNFEKEVKMVSNNWAIKCLATLWVHAGWSSELDLRPTVKEPVDPASTWLPATKSLSLFPDSPLVERMCHIRKKHNPVNEYLLCLRGKKLLLNMCLLASPRNRLQRVWLGTTTPWCALSCWQTSVYLGCSWPARILQPSCMMPSISWASVAFFLGIHTIHRRSHLAPDTAMVMVVWPINKVDMLHLKSVEFKPASTIVTVNHHVHVSLQTDNETPDKMGDLF